jgi:hypothetical protein
MIILIDNVEHKLPQSFNEMTVEQLAVYINEFILNRNALFETDKEGKYIVKNEMLYNKALVRMLFYLLPITWHDFVKMDESWKHYLLYEAQVLSFLNKDMLTELPIKKINHLGATYFGPKNSNLLATEEFSYADKTYQAFFKNQDKKFLNLFVASLFRETSVFTKFKSFLPTFNGDKREVFNKHQLEARAKKMERLSFDVKLTIWFWYHCYRASLPKLHPLVFTAPNESKAGDSDWLNVILGLASEGPFGNYNQVCHTQVHLVLRELNRKAEINNELKKKYANQ